jgi:macrolide-specific efflux system membrane fusion protein
MNLQQRLYDRKPPPSVEPVSTPTKPARRRQSFLRRHPITVTAIAALIVAAIGYGVFSTGGSNTAQPLIVTATRGDVEDLVTALGSLQPFASVDVGAQVSGQLKNIYVKIGDNVEQGQLMAEIDAAIASAKVDADQAQLQNFQAQLGEKQSNLALAKVQADRQTRLLADMATSQDAYDSAQAAFRAAEAQVKSVTAQINQTSSTLKADQANLSYTKIVAPVTGTVSNIVAKQGQTLNANQTTPTIMTLADLSTMTVYTQVSEADVPKLRAGMDAFFTTLGNPNKRFTGKLRQILPTPTVVNNVVLYTALFDVSNPNGELLTQMSAQVFFVRAAAHDVVTVPMAAVQFGSATRGPGAGRAGGQRGGGARDGQGRRGQQNTAAASGSEAEDASVERAATVTVVKDDGSTEVRDVVVGVSDRVTAAILSGLAEGEAVIAGIAVGGGGRGGRSGQGGIGRGPARGPVLFGG